eukprot:15070170-Heterocapsa_arctica.AAC.1
MLVPIINPSECIKTGHICSDTSSRFSGPIVSAAREDIIRTQTSGVVPLVADLAAIALDQMLAAHLIMCDLLPMAAIE